MYAFSESVSRNIDGCVKIRWFFHICHASADHKAYTVVLVFNEYNYAKAIHIDQPIGHHILPCTCTALVCTGYKPESHLICPDQLRLRHAIG